MLRLAVSQPHLLGGHVEGYAALLGEEAKSFSTAIAVRVGLYAAAGALAFLGLTLAGVSLLIFAAVASGGNRAEWALVAIPSAPLLIAVVLVVVVRSRPANVAFNGVKRQVQADMALLREVGSL